jgi:hypothetical protein
MANKRRICTVINKITRGKYKNCFQNFGSLCLIWMYKKVFFRNFWNTNLKNQQNNKNTKKYHNNANQNIK